MSADDDAALRDAFVEQLGRLLELRREGKFDPGVFDEYHAAMVQLSDGHSFGGADWAQFQRINVACSSKTLRAALRRLGGAVAKLRAGRHVGVTE